MLRWHLQQGRSAIPKSTNPGRIKENFDVFDFELTDQELAALDGLDTGVRNGPDPDGADTSRFERIIPEALAPAGPRQVIRKRNGEDVDVTEPTVAAVLAERSGGRPGAALAIASLGFFLITLDILIVNVALPRIGRNSAAAPRRSSG